MHRSTYRRTGVAASAECRAGVDADGRAPEAGERAARGKRDRREPAVPLARQGERQFMPLSPTTREESQMKSAAQPLLGEIAARRETREGRRRVAPTPSCRDCSAAGRAGGRDYRRISRRRVKRRSGGAYLYPEFQNSNVCTQADHRIL